MLIGFIIQNRFKTFYKIHHRFNLIYIRLNRLILVSCYISFCLIYSFFRIYSHTNYFFIFLIHIF
ncbi:hypothetical protein TR13x_04095 [Caloranaerobacter sp. TR13]|nr:hypothetical protein TR13x_04095 [Caloranaerobacter sp. TR13]